VTTTPTPPAGITRAATLLFAIAGGAAVGNLYWAQPLLGAIANTFGISPASAGLAVTASQLGYAVGVFFLVPLGDTVNRKRVIPAMMVLAALMLTATGLAPSFSLLLATLALLGVTSVAGQLLTPLAGDLATDNQRGRVLGTVASGLILGILVSRALSGIVADLWGWRAIYFAAAILTMVLAVVMARFLPQLEPRAKVRYGTLLASVLRTVATSRQVRVTMVIGAAAMAVFTLFWTGITFLLTADPYSFTATQIGLVSLVGIAGAVAAMRVGRLYDRGLSLPAIGIGLLAALVALIISGLGAGSLAAVLIPVAVFSVGVQSVQVLLQTRMLSIDPSARSRLNTVFVVVNFIGGAIGSALAGLVWPIGGWTGEMITGAVIVGIALTIWVVHRTRALAA